MNSKKKYPFLFLSMLVLFIVSITHLDRIFFKESHSFSLRFLYTCLPNDPRWDLPEPSKEELSLLDSIVHQKFHYLDKGAHCFAFISEDKKYVIKFHRYASHMRIFPWLNHPFSYQFNKERKKIKAHNFKTLDYNLANYKTSYENLKEESGLILVHINRTDTLKKTLTLVDKRGGEYKVPLDQVTFILQHKADLIYPTLDRLYGAHQIDQAKAVVSQIIHLMVACCDKGYVDQDPILRKNYGLLENQAIHIDIGDLIRNDTMKEKESRRLHIIELTASLKKRIENSYPQLLDHYNKEISSL